MNEIGSACGRRGWFVIEGDESDRTFLSLGAEIAIITNVEPDHLETYDNDPDQPWPPSRSSRRRQPGCIALMTRYMQVHRAVPDHIRNR